ncbi:MAG: DUF4445 domain-containing protein [Desulfobacterales bacterium]|nr:DUF4445 domain-containing protein [Desulfobacterales bacterium]
MGKCVNHPDRETSFLCMKHTVYMCEECIQCRDPEIHCKFRSSCPIWFMHKRGGKWIDDEKSAKETATHRVVFQPGNKEAIVADGATLLDAAQAADVPLNASCNGKGACGKCKLVLESGSPTISDSPLLSKEEKEKSYLLACMSTVHGDITVRIPEETLEKKLKVAGMGKEATSKLAGLVTTITPMLQRVELELSPPTLEDPISDLDRLYRGLKKSGCDISQMSIGIEVMRELANSVRENNWQVTASVVQKRYSSEVLRVVPENSNPKPLGFAIDVGTTSIVVYLVDMDNGDILAATSGHNRQAACGDDVINRIICAEKNGVKKLSTMVLSTINGLINEAIDSVDVTREHIENVVISGNTTMTHLLLQIEPRHIRREPYVPCVSSFPVLKAGSIGLKVNPIAAVFIMPGPASYVGGDIVSGIIYTGLHKKDGLTLFIDVGTNAEIVLGNKDWLMTASCSAGPAFEGGGVRWGMRAEEGAIEKISIHPDTFVPSLSIVGGGLPRGICGSGMIDLISEMLLTGIIDQSGKFKQDAAHPRLVRDENDTSYIVAYADQTSVGKDIIFSEVDIDNIIRSKGSIYAGFQVLLKQSGLDFSQLDSIIITGGFGQYLDIEKAISIGLLPDIDKNKFKYLGNSSIAGAYMALLSKECRQEAAHISNNMTYVDFSTNTDFMDEFTSALFLPHTNMEAFPSVQHKLKK